MSDELYKQIGQRIRAARGNRYSQTYLAQALGFTQSALSKYERGQRAIPLPDLQRIAAFLGYPMSYFLDYGDTPAPEPGLSTMADTLDMTIVPVYDHHPAGARVAREHPATYVTFPHSLLRGADMALRVLGSSPYAPDLTSGDIVFFRRETSPAADGYALINRSDGTYAIRHHSKLGNDDERIVGHAVGLWRTMKR